MLYIFGTSYYYEADFKADSIDEWLDKTRIPSDVVKYMIKTNETKSIDDFSKEINLHFNNIFGRYEASISDEKSKNYKVIVNNSEMTTLWDYSPHNIDMTRVSMGNSKEGWEETFTLLSSDKLEIVDLEDDEAARLYFEVN